jgi:serine/threonine protein kinase/Tol biopolymer transport system component
MASDRWRQVEDLCHAALARPAEDRAAFLATACAGDDVLRSEVESLLAQESSAAGFMSVPAVVVAGSALDHAKGTLVGQRLGSYAIRSLLGVGGMGEVYRAHDDTLGREVAIKVLPPAFTADPERRARLEREARMLATLNHPHIGAIYGVEDANGVRALVLELVEGETLAERIARARAPVAQTVSGPRGEADHPRPTRSGGMPLADALAIARQIADALEAAHEKGIVHRDLKPANIKITPNGVVKVLDFGLAKAASPDSSRPDVSASRDGAILGTAAYMSPEQARGHSVNKRSDIWAFGCVLYEMLTGRLTFPGDTVSDTIAKILEREPDWSALPAATPAPIRRLLLHCLAKDPKQRLRDIGDVRIELDAIDEVLPGASVQAVGPSASAQHKEANATGTAAATRRPSMAWIAAVALLVVSIALGAVVFNRQAPQEAARISFDIATPSAPSPLHVTVSPDGKYLSALVTSDTGESVIWLRALDRVTAQTVSGTEGAFFPFWSPDSRFIGFFADGKLKKVDILGGAPQTLCDASRGFGGAWNRDGVIVFAPTQDGPLFQVRASGGVPVQLTELDRSGQEIAHRHPYFLPDGRHFIYTAVSTTSEHSAIYASSLDSTDRKRILNSALKAVYAAPDHILFMRDDALMAQAFDPSRLEVSGDPFPIADQVGSILNTSAAGFAVSEGSVLALRHTNMYQRILRWFDRSGKETRTVNVPAAQGGLALSPDLERIAVVKLEGAVGDIWILEQAGGTSSRFTFDPAFDTAPVWSPDGTRIVFASSRNGTFSLYQKNSTGAGREEVLLESDHPKIPEDWSADGRYVLYREQDPKTGWDLWVLPLTGDRKPQSVLSTAFQEIQGRLSPDGRWIAYVSDEPPQVYVQSFPPSGNTWQISTGGGFQPRWRSDGKELFFLAGQDSSPIPRDVMAVAVDASSNGVFKAGVPQKLFTVTTGAGSAQLLGSWDVTPDGQRFLVETPSYTTAVPPVTVVVNWLQRQTTSPR